MPDEYWESRIEEAVAAERERIIRMLKKAALDCRQYGDDHGAKTCDGIVIWIREGRHEKIREDA